MPWTQNDAQVWRAMAASIARHGRISPWNSTLRWGSYREGFGLCSVLVKVYFWAGMPYAQYERLKTALRNARHYLGAGSGAYFWPLTPEGDEQRRLACLQLAAMAEADGGNHGGTP